MCIRDREYIETHMDEAITTADLARVSRFSPWHSYRLFHQHTGLTPADYIRRLRLSQSALRLKRENCRVIDVAYDLGFGSVDGYQRAFLREFGCNPGAYARQPVPIPLFIPYGVKFRALRKESIDMEPIRSVLDVYKRQALVRSTMLSQNISLWMPKSRLSIRAWATALGMPPMPSWRAVSYTHLDVYKRQSVSSAST